MNSPTENSRLWPNLQRDFCIEAKFQYDDPHAKERFAEHSAPIEGEIRGGRWDGLRVEYWEGS